MRIMAKVPECENSDVYSDYHDMMRMIIFSCVMIDGDWVNLPEKFVAEIVVFSRNRVALTIK